MGGLISPTEPDTKVSLTTKENSMETECFTTQTVKFATQEVGNPTPSMVSECCIIKLPQKLQNRHLIGVLI